MSFLIQYTLWASSSMTTNWPRSGTLSTPYFRSARSTLGSKNRPRTTLAESRYSRPVGGLDRQEAGESRCGAGSRRKGLSTPGMRAAEPKEVSPTQVNKQSGQGMVEYALILVLVSIVVIVILLTMGGQIANVFSNIVTALNA